MLIYLLIQFALPLVVTLGFVIWVCWWDSWTFYVKRKLYSPYTDIQHARPTRRSCCGAMWKRR